MLNSEYKKEANSKLKDASYEYKKKYESTMDSIINLYELRLKSVELIKSVEQYINSKENIPKELEIIIKIINTNYKNFENEIKNVDIESKNFKTNDKSPIGAGILAGTGIALGAGLATFGPGAAMAIATTFGTASTGVAISTLSGAAVTTSALAWLGGGAVAAGGGGMAAGTALLSIFGPVGWAIGGAAIAGGGLWANSKNKKVAKEAEESTVKIKEETRKFCMIENNVNSVKRDILNIEESIKLIFYKIKDYHINDYKDFNDTQLDEIKTLLDKTLDLSTALCKKID